MHRTSGWAIAGIIGTTVAVAGVGWLSAPTGAQTDPTVEVEVVSQQSDGTPLPGSVGSAISDNGAVVAFQTVDGVAIRDRVGQTTVIAPDQGATGPAISGDGCIVTYSVPGDEDAQLVALERCTTPAAPTRSVVGTEPVPGGLPAGALSATGDVVAWSTGDSIVRYASTEDGAGVITWERTDEFDVALDPSEDATTGAELDTSPDGNQIAFVASVVSTATPANVYLWTGGATPSIQLVSATDDPTVPGDAASTAPSFGAGGALLAFQTAASDLAAFDETAPAVPATVVLDLSDAQGVQRRLLIESAADPQLAPDGQALVFEQAGATRLQRSLGDGAPFESTDVVDVVAVVDPQTASVSNEGSSGVGNRTVVFDSGVRTDLTVDDRFHDAAYVWAFPVAAQPPPTTTTTSTTTTEATTTTSSSSTTVAPTTTEAPPDTTVPGSFVVPGDGVDNPSSPLPPLSTIDGGAEVGNSGSSGGSGSGSGGQVFGSGSTGGSSSSGSSGNSGSSSDSDFTPTVDPSGDVTVQPSPLEFAPTIESAGRRVATAQVVGGSAAVTVDAVEIVPADNFVLDEDRCTGTSVTSGSTCPIDVAFEPTTTGDLSAELVVTLDDGSTVTAQLTGVGAPEPTLTVIPEVVMSGEVLTLRGGGFPAGSTVEWEWVGGGESGSAVVDDVGSFSINEVVLQHTVRGPHEITVEGIEDLFDDVSTELLVGTRADRTESAVFGRTVSGR